MSWVLAPRGVTKSLQGCEKWILHKILHRYDNQKKSQLFFFDEKKSFRKKIEDFRQNIFLHFDFVVVFHLKILNGTQLRNRKIPEKFPKKYFPIFKIIFFDEKKS